MTAKNTIHLLAACLIAGSANAEAPSWWPGGGDSSKAEKPAAAAAEDSAMFDSSLFQVSWPKVEMPKLSWKPSFGGDQSAAAGKPGGNPISRALDKVATGSKDASDKVRNAWGSAMNSLSMGGGDDTSRTAKTEGGGFWSRLMSPSEPPKQSETVQEFLAQERVGTRR